MSALPQEQSAHEGTGGCRWRGTITLAVRRITAGTHITIAGLAHRLTAQRHSDYVIELIPPRAERRDVLDTLALENLFQSLLLTSHESIALEVYGAPHERRLLARATSARSLTHLCAQMRAHAPQVEVRRVAPPSDAPDQPASQRVSALFDLAPSSLSCDPLILRKGERLRTLELRPRGGAHLPLKLYEHDELGAPGVDPLAGARSRNSRWRWRPSVGRAASNGAPWSIRWRMSRRANGRNCDQAAQRRLARRARRGRGRLLL